MRLRIALTLNLLCIVAATFVLAIPMWGQEVPQPFTGDGVQITGLPDDWTHHHLTFSDPGTEQEALDKGTYSEWVKVVNDPRYLMQQLKRRAQAQGPAAEEVARIEEMAQAQSYIATNPPGRVRRDWSMDMGTGAKVGAGMYPAKFSFNGTANCGSATSPDFVVYNTSLAGSVHPSQYRRLLQPLFRLLRTKAICLLGFQHGRHHLDLRRCFPQRARSWPSSRRRAAAMRDWFF